MERPVTTLFMLMSVDGKISPGVTDDLDFDKDLPHIAGVKAGLQQYYDVEQTTDLWSLNSGRVQYDFLYSLTPELNEAQAKQKEVLYAELERLETLKDDEKVLFGAYGAYWKYLDHYDQVAEAANISQPCLVLQGEEDYQVTMEDFAIWKETYGEKENWEFISYPGLTHLFMTEEKENGSADYLKTQKVDARVIEDIANFILQ